MPIYETDAHREAQRRIVEHVARCLGLVPLHRRTLSGYDALLTERRAPVAVVEVKRRHCTRQTYDTCVVETRKVDALLARCAGTDWWPLFVVQWNDALGMVTAHEARTYPTSHIRLRQPRDADDLHDPCYLVPVEAFVTLVPVTTAVMAADPFTLEPVHADHHRRPAAPRPDDRHARLRRGRD